MTRLGYRIILFGISDRGLRRATNEDHFIVADLTHKVIGVKDNEVTPELICHEIGERGTLLGTADGPGGHDGGEVASRVAVEATVQALLRADDSVTTPPEQLARGVEEAHDAICRHQREGVCTHMASTRTALYIARCA
jgi:serine/threonine protein phosphatase PrpC